MIFPNRETIPGSQSKYGTVFRLGNITGFETRDGLRVGVRGVWVRVAKLIPSPNPYPQDGLTGYGGFFHGFSHSYFFTKNNAISLYNNFFL